VKINLFGLQKTRGAPELRNVSEVLNVDDICFAVFLVNGMNMLKFG